jgi:hypothetical protein
MNKRFRGNSMGAGAGTMVNSDQAAPALTGLRPGCDYAGVGLEENKALVRRYYHEVLTGRDRDLLPRLLDPGFVSHIPRRRGCRGRSVRRGGQRDSRCLPRSRGDRA